MTSTKHSQVRLGAFLAAAGLGVLLASTSSGCAGADLGECPPDSAAQQALGRQAMTDNCLYCHSSQLTGALRQDAPADYNFDDLAFVRAEAEELYGEAEEGAMPPSQPMSAEQIENFRVFLACGAPAP